MKELTLWESGILLLSANAVRETKNRKPNWSRSVSLLVGFGEFQYYTFVIDISKE